MALEVHPVTPDRWDDLVDLFERPGPRGGRPVTSGCWCMAWRLDGPAFDKGWGRGETRGAGNKAVLRKLVHDGRRPGLLAYSDGVPVGWCSLGPREDFVRLERSRALKRLDDQPVWSIVCFYIDREHRGQGVAERLLDAAVKHARKEGARIIEAYGSKAGDSDPFTGYVSMFQHAGFDAVKDTGRRTILRRRLRR